MDLWVFKPSEKNGMLYPQTQNAINMLPIQYNHISILFL